MLIVADESYATREAAAEERISMSLWWLRHFGRSADRKGARSP
jgi:hypothetical protein